MTQPIPALLALRPTAQWPGGLPPRPLPLGEPLQLRIGSGAVGELLAHGPQGLLFTLPPGSARPGDVLLVRVLSIEPQIELQLIEHRPQTAGRSIPGSSDPADAMPALRPDQAWLQRLHLGPGAVESLPIALATQWRQRVLAGVLRQPPPTALLAASGAEHVAEAASAPLPLYPLPGWPQLTLLLRLLSPAAPAWPQATDDAALASDTEAAAQAQEQQGLRLQLSVTLEGETVQLLLQWQHGLLLYFVTESLPLLQALRQRLPQIALALASIPMPVRYCLFGRQIPAGQRPAARPSQGLAHTSSAALFRAAAEIVAVLQREPLLPPA